MKSKILSELIKRAKSVDKTIILPEANIDSRVYDAAKIVLKKHLSKIVVLGKESDFGKEFFCPECKIIDIENFEDLSKFASQLFELRKAKGMTLDEANLKIKQADYFSMMLLKNGYADGLVAGATWTTANTLRPALQLIKTKPNKSIVTGVMLMLKHGIAPLVFADVSLIENPTSAELGQIADSSAEFMEKIIGFTPKVAMLSYSTKGSAKSDMVEKVRQATEIAKNSSRYMIDGEMQVDSALDHATATKKGVISPVGGEANVLVFPDLNAGNIGYKLTSRLGGFLAIGPIMLNFNKPVNDLSRGSNVEEIINTICMTKLQCEN